MILTPNERSFYLAPDDISFFSIITVPFDPEPPPTDDLLDAVSEEVSSGHYRTRLIAQILLRAISSFFQNSRITSRATVTRQTKM